jgi:DNA mismatch repair protein MutS2
LSDIHRQREATGIARQAAESAQTEAQKLARELRDRLHSIDRERAAILDAARDDAARQIAALSEEIDSLRKRLSAAQQAEVEAVRARAAELEARVEPPPQPPIEIPEAGPRRPIRAGDTVWVRPLNTTGQVISIAGRDAELGVGALRTRARLDDLEWRSSPQPATGRESSSIGLRLSSEARLEIDLRGLRADEAVRELEKRLEAAYLSGMPFVRVIHGKGTGSLRKAVREALRGNPVVSAAESGQEGEGGDGVTVVRLLTN